MPKVLVVNGNLASAKRLVSALTKSGFEVALASSESEGFKLAKEISPQAIVIRSSLPQLDGFSFCRRIRCLFDHPTILLGTEAVRQAHSKAVEAGADFYMCLPVSYSELAARLKTLLWRYGKLANEADEHDQTQLA